MELDFVFHVVNNLCTKRIRKKNLFFFFSFCWNENEECAQYRKTNRMKMESQGRVGSGQEKVKINDYG